MADKLFDDINEHGGFREYIGKEFFLSLIITSFLCVAHIMFDIKLDKSVLSIIFTASAPLLGLTLAGYSLLLSIGNDNFKRLFHNHSLFHALRIDFSITAIAFGVASILALCSFILFQSANVLVEIAFLCALFFFLWGILNIIMLMARSLRVIGELISKT